MLDPLTGDALEGFDAVPGDHSAALSRLAGEISSSAAGGKASARSRTSHMRQQRVQGWSMAVAAVFLAAATVGAVWLFDDDDSDGKSKTVVRESGHGWLDTPVEPTLPPVTVIPNDPASASNPSGATLDNDEIHEISVPAADTVVTTAFRRFVADSHASIRGRVTLYFEVDHQGRPRNMSIVSTQSPEASAKATELLSKGPDWPIQPARKQIVIDL
jgi:hypothetical protein